MAYGKVRLGDKDRDYIEGVFSRHKAALTLKLDAATDAPERTFYQNAIKSYEDVLAKLAVKRSKVSFSEEELKTLCGALFGWEQRDVAAAYGRAFNSSDTGLATALKAELAYLDQLEPVLAKPFILDRSQDAEDEEGEEDNAEEDDIEGEGH